MRKLFLSLALLAPVSAYAASSFSFKTIANSFSSVIVNSVMGLLIVGAAAAFFFGIARYIFGYRTGDANTIKEGNTFILWGGVSLFIMMSFWGIITFVQGQFGLGGDIRIPSSSLKSSYGLLSSPQTAANGSTGVRSALGGTAQSVSQNTGQSVTKSIAKSVAAKPEKKEDTSGVCEPDADGTTYYEDPKNPSECLPSSPCAPGYDFDAGQDMCIKNQNPASDYDTCMMNSGNADECAQAFGAPDTTFNADTNGDGQVNVYDDTSMPTEADVPGLPVDDAGQDSSENDSGMVAKCPIFVCGH